MTSTSEKLFSIANERMASARRGVKPFSNRFLGHVIRNFGVLVATGEVIMPRRRGSRRATSS